jgi:GNAT superfamily N-acetyltransferase
VNEPGAFESWELRATDRAGVEPYLAGLAAEGMGILPDEPRWFVIYEDGEGCGTLRIHECDGATLIDDVWIAPPFRARGIATGALLMARLWAGRRGARAVWLLCDEDMVSFYERRAFATAEPGEFPEPFAALCELKGEWPAAPDHAHVAMRAPVALQG